jgi:hypothetical protein
MPILPSEYWTELLRRSLEYYSEPLLRQVAARLARVRSQWPAEELIGRCIDAVTNAATLDRRLAELDAPSRQVLALMGHSRRFRWRLGSLVEMAMSLGAVDGLKPILDLLEAGLLYPEFTEGKQKLKNFDQCLVALVSGSNDLFTHPMIAARALSPDDSWPTVSAVDAEPAAGAVEEADGLEWPLRLAALWQLACRAPVRRTISGEFFKRDHERLTQDSLLSQPPAEFPANVPDLPFLAVCLAEAEEVLLPVDSELHAAPRFTALEGDSGNGLASLWKSLFGLEGWDPLHGRRGPDAGPGNPFPSACLLALMLLARLPSGTWARPEEIQRWLVAHHPAWSTEQTRSTSKRDWMSPFLLGVCHQLRAVQSARSVDGHRLVRLSQTGRWLMGLGEQPLQEAPFARTLLVQPNLEIIVYRQGLTPDLIARLTTFAVWKTQGSACTLQLEPEAVYRSLEMGMGFDEILQTLEQHGTRPTPPSVIEMLRTWSNKRERISVYASGAILEFSRPEDLEEALARGVPAVRLSDRLAVVANENAIDFRHFRLTGTRDYHLPQEKCVAVEEDGVTLHVDVTRSDLLLETELERFARNTDRTAASGKKQYRLTPESLAAARASGMNLPLLQTWFLQRTGQTLPPAAELLMGESREGTLRLRRLLVLHVANEHLADGLFQWPESRRLIEERLGPTAFAVPDENVAPLRDLLRGLGIDLAADGDPSTSSTGQK